MNTKQYSLSDFLDNIEEDSINYPELRNYEAYKELLKDENSSLSRLVKLLIETQPNRSLIDLACALAGAINLTAYCMSSESQRVGAEILKGKTSDIVEESVLKNARELFWDTTKLDKFVETYRESLVELVLSNTNCPTVPQRVFPLATFLPRKGSVGIIELGCSRGDLGLALLNPERVLRPIDEKEEGFPYLFCKPTSEEVKQYELVCPNGDVNKAYRPFGGKTLKNTDISAVSVMFPERSWREILKCSRSIDKYFGVDLLDEKQTNSDWLLALWGLYDPRRKVLARFYRDFKAQGGDRFKRVTADALVVEKYLSDALEFMSNVDNLVLFTSYMVYQLDISQRFRLADVVRRIQNTFKALSPNKRFYWFNQGAGVSAFFKKRELSFDSLYFSELRFNEGNRLEGRDLALLADDCNSNWTSTADVCESSYKLL